eukprot:TRINITY_DN532_c0_g3_i2.p1 TRINITY_DN532_c0_g3~~TRINITY_DN532_c0_g3_i2.p1  ORF type:complete len:2181 (-),score=449.01 TRINITY_DN532_c0_g3_i2:21-6563(-)
MSRAPPVFGPPAGQGTLVYREPHIGQDISYLLDKAGHGRAPRPGEYTDRKVPPSVIPKEHYIKKVYPTPPSNLRNDHSCEYNSETGSWEVTLFPSANPSGRDNVLLLAKWIQGMLEKVKVTDDNDVLPALYKAQRIYAMALHEITRQTMWGHAERGALLKKLCKFHFVMFQRLLTLAKKQNQFDRGAYVAKLKEQESKVYKQYDTDVEKLLALYKEEEDEAEANNAQWQVSIDRIQKEIEDSVEEMKWYETQEDSIRQETGTFRNLLRRVEERSAKLQNEFGNVNDGFLKHLDLYWGALTERVLALRRCEQSFRRKLGDRVAKRWTGYSLEMQRQFDEYGMNDYIPDPENVLEQPVPEENIDDVPAWDEVMEEMDTIEAVSTSTESEELIQDDEGIFKKVTRRRRKVKLKRTKATAQAPKRLLKKKGKVALSRVAKYVISDAKISDRLLKWKKKRKVRTVPKVVKKKRIKKKRTLPSGREESYSTTDEEDMVKNYEYAYAYNSGVAPTVHQTITGTQTDMPSYTDAWLNPDGTRETGYSHVISATWNQNQRVRAQAKLKGASAAILRGHKALSNWKGSVNEKKKKQDVKKSRLNKMRAKLNAKLILDNILDRMFAPNGPIALNERRKKRTQRKVSARRGRRKSTTSGTDPIGRNASGKAGDSLQAPKPTGRRRSIAVPSSDFSPSTGRRRRGSIMSQQSTPDVRQPRRRAASSHRTHHLKRTSLSAVSSPKRLPSEDNVIDADARADFEKYLTERMNEVLSRAEVPRERSATDVSDHTGLVESDKLSDAASINLGGERVLELLEPGTPSTNLIVSPPTKQRATDVGANATPNNTHRPAASSRSSVQSNSLGMVSTNDKGRRRRRSTLGVRSNARPGRRRSSTMAAGSTGHSRRSSIASKSNRGDDDDTTSIGLGSDLGTLEEIEEEEILEEEDEELYEFPYAVFADMVRLQHVVPIHQLADGTFAIVKSRSLLWTRRHINQIYEVKISTDSGETKSKLKKKNQPFADFIYDFYLFKYGLRDLTELNVVELMDQTMAYQDEDSKCRLFSRFVGLEPEYAMPLAAVNFYLSAKNLLILEGGDRYKTDDETDRSTVSLSATLRTVQRLFAGLPAQDLQSVERAVLDMPRDEVLEGKSIVTSVDGDEFLSIAMDMWERYEKINVSVLKVFFRAGDYDDSGNLNYDEFGAIMREIDPVITEREVGLLFEKATADGVEGNNGEESLTWPNLIQVLRNAGLVTYRPQDVLLLEDSQSTDFFADLRETWNQRVPLILSQFEELRGYEGHDTVDRLAQRMDFVERLLAKGPSLKDPHAGAIAYHAVKITINMCNYTLEMYRRGILDRQTFIAGNKDTTTESGAAAEDKKTPGSRRRRSISHNLGGFVGLHRTDSGFFNKDAPRALRRLSADENSMVFSSEDGAKGTGSNTNPEELAPALPLTRDSLAQVQPERPADRDLVTAPPVNPWEQGTSASTTLDLPDRAAPTYRHARRKSVISMLPAPDILNKGIPAPPDPTVFAVPKEVADVEAHIPSPRSAAYVPSLGGIRESRLSTEEPVSLQRISEASEAASVIDVSVADLTSSLPAEGTVPIDKGFRGRRLSSSHSSPRVSPRVSPRASPRSSPRQSPEPSPAQITASLPYRRERSRRPKDMGENENQEMLYRAPVPAAESIATSVPRKETLKEQDGSRSRTMSTPTTNVDSLTHSRSLGFGPKAAATDLSRNSSKSVRVRRPTEGKIDSSGLDVIEKTRNARRRRSTINVGPMFSEQTGSMSEFLRTGSPASGRSRAPSVSSLGGSAGGGPNVSSISLSYGQSSNSGSVGRMRLDSLGRQRTSTPKKNVTVVDLSQNIDFAQGGKSAKQLDVAGPSTDRGATGIATGLPVTLATRELNSNLPERKMGSVVSAMMTVMRWKKKIQKTLQARAAAKALAEQEAAAASIARETPGANPWQVRDGTVRRATYEEPEDDKPKKVKGLTKKAAEIRLGLVKDSGEAEAVAAPVPSVRSRLDTELEKALGRAQQAETDAPVKDENLLSAYAELDTLRPQASANNLILDVDPVDAPAADKKGKGRMPVPPPRKVVYANVQHSEENLLGLASPDTRSGRDRLVSDGDALASSSHRRSRDRLMSEGESDHGGTGDSEPLHRGSRTSRTRLYSDESPPASVAEARDKQRFIHKPGFTPVHIRTKSVSKK